MENALNELYQIILVIATIVVAGNFYDFIKILYSNYKNFEENVFQFESTFEKYLFYISLSLIITYFI